MELEEAASRIQIMLNFFNGLQKLQEVVEVARSVDNIKQLAQERADLASKAGADLMKARANLEQFTAQSSAQMNQMTANLAAVEEANRQKVADIEAAFQARKLELENAMAFVEERHSSQVQDLAKQLSDLTTNRDALQQQIDNLNSVLSDLKAKVTNL